jgi:23S rRNA A1618 N6-methylase RlmF
MIVNTHSSNFVNEIMRESKSCSEISIWFSKLVSKVSSNMKHNYKITKLIPVTYSHGQIPLDFIEDSEIAMNEIEVQRFLETKDLEN